jgi:hypothetical protein
MTPEVLAKLEGAYLNDATDIEACAIAGIGSATLYNFLKANPEFVERRATLKSMTNYRSKEVIIGKINEGDEKQANWWLERKGKDDGFSIRNEITGKDGGNITFEKIATLSDEELETLIKEYDS